MRARTLVILGLVGLAAQGCSERRKKKSSPPAPTSAPAPTAVASVTAAPPAAKPPPASGKRPNILFILSDDQRADSIACMPRLNKLMGSQGVTFSNYYATTPLCCPGRTTLLTGKYAHNHGVLQNGDTEDGDETKTPGAVDFQKNGNEGRIVARWLQEAGYRTGFAGKYLNGYEKMVKNGKLHVPPHWDDWYAFPHAEYYNFSLVERPRGGKAELVCYRSPDGGKREGKACKEAGRTVDDGKENYSTDVLKEKAITFIKAAAAEGKPFFLYLAPKAPHGPFESPKRYQPDPKRDTFTKEAMARLGDCPLFDWKNRPASVLEEDVSDKPPWIQEGKGKLAMEKVDKVRRKQLVSVLAIEDALEEILATLDALGQRQDTILIYNGDNGYAWGEHWWIGKNCAYEECARVPLVIFDPRAPTGGRTEASFAINADLAPTMAELAGVPIPAGIKPDGMSLAPLLSGKPGARRDELLIECWGNETRAHPDIHAAIRTARWKYVEHYADEKMTRVKPRAGGGREVELYDLQKDPHELDNLAALPEPERQKRGLAAGEADKVMGELAPRLKKLETQ